jgi:hypothetical protein
MYFRILLGTILAAVWAVNSPAAFAQDMSSQEFKLSDLKSSDTIVAMSAFNKIAYDPAVMKRPEVKVALFDLLKRENRFISDVNSKPRKDDDNSEYESDLPDRVATIADWHDPNQVCILAHSSYNSASVIPSKLAVQAGVVAVPCLLKTARGEWTARYQSIPILVHLSAATKNLDPVVRERIKQIILSGVKDPEEGVRMETARALGNFGEPDMIPALEKLAKSDPEKHVYTPGAEPVFYVREIARKAIVSIQTRSKTR